VADERNTTRADQERIAELLAQVERLEARVDELLDVNTALRDRVAALGPSVAAIRARRPSRRRPIRSGHASREPNAVQLSGRPASKASSPALRERTSPAANPI